jgi:hypothetical protein
MRATSITRAIGRGGRALKIEKFLGLKWQQADIQVKKIKQQKKHLAMGYRSQAHLICLNDTLSKRLSFSTSPAGMSLTRIIKLFPACESLVSYILAGDGKKITFFTV